VGVRDDASAVVENVGMNIGVLPIAGIPLPLISYGGSATISTWPPSAGAVGERCGRRAVAIADSISAALVQSLAVPKPDASLSACHRQRWEAIPRSSGRPDPGSTACPRAWFSVQARCVFCSQETGTTSKVGAPGIDGIDVEVKVLAHRRGPRVESLRYKSKSASVCITAGART